MSRHSFGYGRHLGHQQGFSEGFSAGTNRGRGEAIIGMAVVSLIIMGVKRLFRKK